MPIVVKNQQAVLRIKSPNRQLIDNIRDKLAELNDDGLRVVSGFVEKDRDGVSFYVYVNVIVPVSDEVGKH